MTALMTRMMTMVAASRLVTAASPESSSNAFTRARMPAGEAVADRLSITATGGIVLGLPRNRAGIVRSINESLRMGWVVCDVVVPGHAKHEPGTHNHRTRL